MILIIVSSQGFWMKKVPWYVSPPAVFVFSLISIIAAIVFYIYWAVKAQIGIEEFLEKFNLSSDPLLEVNTWLTILVYSFLFGVVLVGLVVIYVYYYRLIKLYRLQNSFISSFTHELKTPITSISLIVEMIKNQNLTGEELNKYLGFLVDDCGRLNSISEHILKTGHLESGNYKPNYQKINFNKWMDSFLEKNKRNFKKAKINFSSNSDQEIYVDSVLCEMLFSNLIQNGIKYNDNEEKCIEIKLNDISQKFISVEVIDNGIGIHPKHFKNLFKKFYQAGDAMNMSAKGSGLGLYLCSMICSVHKGKITPFTNPQSGMIFEVTFPKGKK
tara:strand:+ start:7348 stop:8334 length:987 start_codon:yes stop_codon:yes gene_type:complete